MRPVQIILSGLFLSFIATPILAQTGEGCGALLTQLDGETRAADFDAARRTVDRIDQSSACSAAQIERAKAFVASALLRKAAKLQADQNQAAAYRALLVDASRYGVSWEASWRLADVQMREKRFTEAASGYQQAVEILSRQIEAVPASQRDPALVRTGTYLVKRSEEARHLAASPSAEGTLGTFVSALPSHRGGVGGVYSEDFGRGIEATKVPPPITFVFDSTELTPVGKQAAAELVDVLRARNPGHISVTGHTDQRGSDTYNLDLSKRRAAAVVTFLKGSGITSAFAATGKGRAEPRALSNPADYSQSEIDELNRRVEIDWNS